MSRRRNYSQQTLAIMGRFFEALNTCIEYRLIKNVSRFCDDNGIDKRNFYHQQKDIGRGFFEVSWMLPLIKCGISPMWLLTGSGLMFEPTVVNITLRQSLSFDQVN